MTALDNKILFSTACTTVTSKGCTYDVSRKCRVASSNTSPTMVNGGVEYHAPRVCVHEGLSNKIADYQTHFLLQ